MCWQTDLENGKLSEDRFERAVRFWYVVRSAFGAHPHKGWAFQRTRPRNSATVLQNALANIRAIHERLKSVEIDHLDFRRCIKNRDGPEGFLFLDPPYLDTCQYRVGTFTLEDHQDLAELVTRAKSKWLLTIGDHPKIRKLYSGFQIERVRTHITVSKIIGGKRPTFKQLIIRNYEPPKTSLYTCAASQPVLMDLFGLEAQGIMYWQSRGTLTR